MKKILITGAGRPRAEQFQGGAFVKAEQIDNPTPVVQRHARSSK